MLWSLMRTFSVDELLGRTNALANPFDLGMSSPWMPAFHQINHIQHHTENDWDEIVTLSTSTMLVSEWEIILGKKMLVRSDLIQYFPTKYNPQSIENTVRRVCVVMEMAPSRIEDTETLKTLLTQFKKKEY